jgi:hypothetical protein
MKKRNLIKDSFFRGWIRQVPPQHVKALCGGYLGTNAAATF